MAFRRALVLIAAALVLVLVGAPATALAAPEGQVIWGVHVSLAPTWFDPADTIGMITPFMVFYALHDAMVKPMPGQPTAPSLAESWSVSKDGPSTSSSSARERGFTMARPSRPRT